MEIKNLKIKETPLLARKRIKFELEHNNQSTPTKIKLKEDIAKKYNVNPDLVAIRHIYGKFGLQTSKVIAHIYENEKTLKELETRKGKKEDKKSSS